MAAPYDPWRHLAQRWPAVVITVEAMRGTLLGELRYPLIALRAGTSAAQRRCTLAHEIVHLERGVTDCGPWAAAEEQRVHEIAARRLIRAPELLRALRELGDDSDPAALAALLDVDRQTLRLRLARLLPDEQAWLHARLESGYAA